LACLPLGVILRCLLTARIEGPPFQVLLHALFSSMTNIDFPKVQKGHLQILIAFLFLFIVGRADSFKFYLVSGAGVGRGGSRGGPGSTVKLTDSRPIWQTLAIFGTRKSDSDLAGRTAPELTHLSTYFASKPYISLSTIFRNLTFITSHIW
jgi:hypothetical protein